MNGRLGMNRSISELDAVLLNGVEEDNSSWETCLASATARLVNGSAWQFSRQVPEISLGPNTKNTPRPTLIRVVGNRALNFLELDDRWASAGVPRLRSTSLISPLNDMN